MTRMLQGELPVPSLLILLPSSFVLLLLRFLLLLLPSSSRPPHITLLPSSPTCPHHSSLFLEKYNALYCETSAKTGAKVDEAFQMIGERLRNDADDVGDRLK